VLGRAVADSGLDACKKYHRNSLKIPTKPHSNRKFISKLIRVEHEKIFSTTYFFKFLSVFFSIIFINYKPSVKILDLGPKTINFFFFSRAPCKSPGSGQNVPLAPSFVAGLALAYLLESWYLDSIEYAIVVGVRTKEK